MDEVLVVKDLHVHFVLENMTVKAVDGVSFHVSEGEALALIGESGSGKSVLGMTILRLLPENVRVGGKILFNGLNLLELPEEGLREIRGREIAWVPQNPATSLNPVLRVGIQIAEPMEVHMGIDRKTAIQRVVGLLRYFDINPAEKRVNQYPHQYSGGMRQRALVAMGTSTQPRLIIADEPTKGVDVTKKVRVAELFRKIKKNSKPSLLIITHDLPFAERLADRVAVMYCGQIVEVCDARTFFEEPLHPYSKALLNSLPSRGLNPIKGYSPSMVNPPEGCRFHPRCDHATDKCLKEPPFDGEVRCWLYA
ncbi:oligopeptide/dipeptide ABC transporter, ATP-binding protein, C-terminal domain protein [Archaeoglobus sulfaticallidus PM70-1]|uniref:Nickel import system ATP-binding protein NikD n=1 Tax=Archaeoglobus sulfaticallidus PM70-1 TaxID=387631 RepID=N0BL46_9EURY|nr:ABC transporter ATP-binding protein [Archaeoglobus sulfaticallidus]AGK60930.1 oligopeptide/dipeptide ABC transporter, ATP-binding protein, C-terminal domain protein [Archaeoglobus sulfaticallidus PM70-1]